MHACMQCYLLPKGVGLSRFHSLTVCIAPKGVGLSRFHSLTVCVVPKGVGLSKYDPMYLVHNDLNIQVR